MSQRRHLIYSFQQEDLNCIKRKMLNWVKQFNIFSFLDNNHYQHAPNHFECIMAAEAMQLFNHPAASTEKDWLFGHICYEFGQQYFQKFHWKPASENGFPLCSFFQPDVVCYIPFRKSEIHISSLKSNPKKVLKQILSTEDSCSYGKTKAIEWLLDFDKSDYFNTIDKIKNDIRNGDYYELNFCVKATATQNIESPAGLFEKLNQSNPSPFAAFYRYHENYLISASPERFINKTGDILTAQPIKGTIRRSLNSEEDAQLQQELKSNIKEQAENLMITDLMRNDLAKVCEVGSISVPDLLSIFHFPTLHHLISTIKGKLQQNIDFKTVLEATFPMGSMTGAPKKIVMERIDEYEKQVRGLYSGSVGYLMPNGDFDFNVIIRSILYNEKVKSLSYATGGAITYDSIDEKEWQEVGLKADAMRMLFS